MGQTFAKKGAVGAEEKGKALHVDTEVQEEFLPHAIISSAAEYCPIGIDIGGSLCKVTWVSECNDDEKSEKPRVGRPRLQSTPNLAIIRGALATPLNMSLTNGDSKRFLLHFIRMANVDEFIEFLRQNKDFEDFFRKRAADGLLKVNATGGGAYKFAPLFRDRLNFSLEKQDEMECLVLGLNLLLKQRQCREVFTFDIDTRERSMLDNTGEIPFPYLLVNIGSGTSILKVTDERTFTRWVLRGGQARLTVCSVGGSSLGGATYLGLCRLLTNLNSFDSIREVEKDGQQSSVDLMVGDIYGSGDYLKHLGLTPDIIASSFGKVAACDSAEKRSADFTPADITKSLLLMICNTIAQIACLTAQLHGLDNVFFAGGFLREKSYVWYKLSWAMSFWSGGGIPAKFLLHDGFLGSLGALCRGTGHSVIPQLLPTASRTPTHTKESE